MSSTLGGMLIGLSAFLFLWRCSRIAGISGITQSALFGPGRLTPVVFLAGLALGAGLVFHATPFTFELRPPLPAWQLLMAGPLVGVGTALGNGCTSGHGICGLARLSLRSLVAVVVFMGTGFVTVWLLRHGFAG